MFRAILILLLSLTACAGRRSALPDARSTAAAPLPATQLDADFAAFPPITSAFEGVAGTLTVTDEHGAVTLLVLLSGLDPAQAYAISVGQAGAGALFDVHTAQVLAGSARGETTFVPDLAGTLRLRATHPERIVRNGRVMVYPAISAVKPLGQSETIILSSRSP